MSLRISLRATLRIALVLLVGIALLPVPCVSVLVSAMGQGQSQGHRQGPPPRPGRPEGMVLNLDDVQSEKSIEREAPAPIPSTIRSQRNSGHVASQEGNDCEARPTWTPKEYYLDQPA